MVSCTGERKNTRMVQIEHTLYGDETKKTDQTIFSQPGMTKCRVWGLLSRAMSEAQVRTYRHGEHVNELDGG